MFYNLAGTVGIFFGLWFLIRPDALKRRLQRKITVRFRWMVMGLLIFIALSMITASFRFTGVAPKVLALFGIILAIRLTVVLFGKGASQFLDWWAGQPIVFFRIAALILLATSVFFVVL